MIKVLMRWMKLEPIIQSEVSQKEKHQYSILTHITLQIQKLREDLSNLATLKSFVDEIDGWIAD